MYTHKHIRTFNDYKVSTANNNLYISTQHFYYKIFINIKVSLNEIDLKNLSLKQYYTK